MVSRIQDLVRRRHLLLRVYQWLLQDIRRICLGAVSATGEGRTALSESVVKP